MCYYDSKAAEIGHRPGEGPDDGDLQGHDVREPGHLAAAFFDRIVTRFEGTRLGRQELLAEILEVSEGAWFSGFDPSSSVTARAEYVPGLPVVLAIDCGVSRHVAAVWFQVGPQRWDLPAGIPDRFSPPITSAGWTGLPRSRWCPGSGTGDGDRVRRFPLRGFILRGRGLGDPAARPGAGGRCGGLRTW